MFEETKIQKCNRIKKSVYTSSPMTYKFLFPNKAINQKLNRYCNNFYNLLRIIQRPNSSPVVMNGQRERKFPRATPSSILRRIQIRFLRIYKRPTVKIQFLPDPGTIPFSHPAVKSGGKYARDATAIFHYSRFARYLRCKGRKKKLARKRSFLRRVSGQLVNKWTLKCSANIFHQLCRDDAREASRPITYANVCVSIRIVYTGEGTVYDG